MVSQDLLDILRCPACVSGPNRREGPVLYYRLNDEHINSLINIGLEHIRE